MTNQSEGSTGQRGLGSAGGFLAVPSTKAAATNPPTGGLLVDQALVDSTDPLTGDPRVMQYLGDSYEVMARFHALLSDQGVLRGLIGPREAGRLWERHLLNSASVAAFLPSQGRLIDVGSGAGLPGVVLAAMLPGVEVTLLEPMERRVDWLEEVAGRLGLANVVVLRGRAEEIHGKIEAEVVTARAVAPLDRLVRWTMPLLVRGGVLVALKGRQASSEVAAARNVLKKFGAGPPEVLEAGTIDGVESTTVVRITRENVRNPKASKGPTKKPAGRG